MNEPKHHTAEKDAPPFLCRLGIHRRSERYGAGGVEPCRIWVGYCVRCGDGRDIPPGVTEAPGAQS